MKEHGKVTNYLMELQAYPKETMKIVRQTSQLGKNSKLLDEYTFNFLHDEYQITTTKNYINSLYTYLEHFGYKHLHFFGWKNCIIDEVYENKLNFLKENFGEVANIVGKDHPNKEGHLKWAEHLHQKIKEFNFTKKQLI